LNKKPLPNADLGDRLKAIYDARQVDKIMYLKAHKELKYSKVIDAIDIAAHAGVRVTGMITDPIPGTKSTVAGENVLQEGMKGGKP
jgi:biopolymer transport protein TolR